MANTKISKSILLVISIVPLIITPWNMDYFYAPKIFTVLGMVLYMAWICRTRECLSELYNPRENFLLYMYLFTIIISTIFSRNIFISIYGEIFREEGLITILVYMSIYLYTKKYYIFSDKHVFWFILTACLVSSYGIVQYYGFDPIPRDVVRSTWRESAFSTIGNPNFLGTFLVLLLPISIFTWLSTLRIFYFIASCIMFLCLLCTNTRSAWLGTIAALGLFLVYMFKYKQDLKRFLYMLSVFIFITIVFNTTSSDKLVTCFNSIFKDVKTVITQRENSNSAGSNRMFIWKKTLVLISKNPLLGVGLENLDTAVLKEYEENSSNNNGSYMVFDRAHNEYLHIAVTTGIPSLILYLIFVGSIIKKGYEKIRERLILIPVFCSVVGYLVQAFFNVSVVSVAYIYWIFLGVIVNFTKNDELVDIKTTSKRY